MPKADKIFVTGIYGSGKTHFAKRYANKLHLKYIAFDKLFSYQNHNNQSRDILNNLPASFVIDAIPINEKGEWTDFLEYEEKNDVLVVCVYCPGSREWIKRLARQKHSVSIRDNLKNYRDFFSSRLPYFHKFKQVEFYDTTKGEFTSEIEMLGRIKYRCFSLEEHLDNVEASYDKNYQDIEVLDSIGYSKSYKTWNAIKHLVGWQNKKVVDIGCFNGYFSFKVEDYGGVVQGLDKSETALTTARIINNIRGGDVTFSKWISGEDIPECDIVLCLNSLHHFGNGEAQDEVISKLNCRTAIFEVNREQEPMIKKHFMEVNRFKSHRRNRVILLCVSIPRILRRR